MASYYVRADGSATKANAIGPASNAAACMSVTTFNAGGFSAGDTVLFSSQGGDYSAAQVVIPSDGSAGNPIVYANVPTETPTFNFSTPSGCVLMIARSWVTIDGFVVANPNASAYCVALRIAGVCGGTIRVSNCTLSGGYAVDCDATGTVDLVFDGVEVGTIATDGIYCYGNSTTSVTAVNCTNAAFYLRYCAVTLDNCTSTRRTYLQTTTGALSISNMVYTGVDGGSDANLQIGSATHSGTISNVTIANGVGTGIRIRF